ncbi:MAG: hypothetical protein ACR2PA_13760 [Hyphomicrobiaceae bacterium]
MRSARVVGDVSSMGSELSGLCGPEPTDNRRIINRGLVKIVNSEQGVLSISNPFLPNLKTLSAVPTRLRHKMFH